MQSMQRNATQGNAIVQFVATQPTQSTQCIVNNASGGVVVDACGGAKNVTLYASEMHALHACI